MSDKSKPKLVPPALTVKVTCTAGHRLSGLFVIFKLLLAAGSTKQDDLHRILEATPDPGTEPVAPAPLTAEQSAVAGATAAYKASKAQLEKDKAAWDKAKALHDAALDKETPSDPADQFVLGIVNHQGYLVPVHTAYNPWYDVVNAVGRDPDAYKLLAGEKYEACLLRHPSPVLARALSRHLNKKATSDDAKYNFTSWGTLTRTIEITSASGGAESVIQLSEDAADYVPKGAERYGKWVIYRAMPHRYCPGVAPNTEKVLADLGRLRYPIGEHGSPFSPMEFKAKPDAEKLEEGGFDRQAQAAACRFHENVNAGKAFLLTYKALAHGGSDWAYVMGTAFDTATGAADVKWTPLSHASFMLGVMDAETATRIEHWIDKGLRKPQEVLIPSLLGYGIWMLERGEIALSAWSMLAEAFGCKYGVKPGSSLRPVRVFAWSGAINNSVHKTGLACDMSGGADRNPSDRWPIRYEASWLKSERKAASETASAQKSVDKAQADLDKKKAAGSSTTADEETLKKANAQLQHAKDDDADSKLYWRTRWRVYGHSTLEMFNAAALAGEIAKLKTAIAAYAGLPDPAALPADPTVALGPPRGKLWKAFKDQMLKGVSGADVEKWLDDRLQPFVDYAKSLLTMTAESLIDAYFRSEVTQFIPNPYESDGGSGARKYKPTEGDGDYPAQAWAKSWINLSAIGYPCQMERIGPHTMDFRDQEWVQGKDSKKAQPKTWAMSGYFSTTSEEDSDFVLMLSDITAPEADAPQNKHRDTPIPVKRGGTEVATYKPSELDGKFILSWKKAALKLDASLRPRSGKTGGNTDAGGAQIALLLSATAKGKEKVDAAVSAIEGQFGDKHFVVTMAGPLASVATNVSADGKTLAADLKAAMKNFEAQATINARKKTDEQVKQQSDAAAAKKKAEDDAIAAGKPPSKPPVKTKTQIAAEKKAAAEAAATETKKLVTDWTVVIQPLFPRTPDVTKLTFLPTDSVVLPPGSNAAHLEWWHYQHRSAGPTWGALLEECGYSLKAMAVPLEGNSGPEGTPIHLGLGYTQKEVDSSPGAFNEGPVENRDPVTPLGG